MAKARPTLADRLREQIARNGPMTVEAYMQACLADPEYGYYRTRNPLGGAGDFITAPEISQIFGELLGLWSAQVWKGMGAPAPFNLIELGPGRGTLIADALRAMAKVAPECLDAVALHLVEISSPLRAQQKNACQHLNCSVHWHDRLNEVPSGPAILIANEFLDALPVRQFVRRQSGWCERMVGLAGDGTFVFLAGSDIVTDQSVLPHDVQGLEAKHVEEGTVVELRPGSIPIVEEIFRRAKDNAVIAIFIDYGYAHGGTGDTLQAVNAHKFADPLKGPGEADLTTHVDFSALARCAEANGLAVYGPMTQGQFLLSLGLAERTERLTANVSQAQAQLIASGAQRLVDPAQMGTLFKVMVFAGPGLPPPAPF